MKTANENVYIAKLDVVICDPNMLTTHWSAGLSDSLTRSFARARPGLFGSAGTFAVHGVLLSEKKTPRSRANCSNVTGRNDPRRSG